MVPPESGLLWGTVTFTLHTPDDMYTSTPISAATVTLFEVKLPIALRVLHFGDEYNQRLDDVMWPPCMEALSLGARFYWTLGAHLGSWLGWRVRFCVSKSACSIRTRGH